MTDPKTQCLLNAQWRRDQTLAKLEEGLERVVALGKPLDLKTIAEVSGVSRAWLHKYPSVKKRIRQLQLQKLTAGGFSPEAFAQLLELYKDLESGYHKLERDNKNLLKKISST